MIYISPELSCPTAYGAVLVLQPVTRWHWAFGWHIGWQPAGCLY